MPAAKKYAGGTKHVTVRLPVRLLARIEEEAAQVGLHRSDVIVQKLRAGMRQSGSKKP